MKIRMVRFYPHLCLEAEATDSEGITYYTNISLPWNDGDLMENLYEDDWWSYTKPVLDVDMENVEDYYYYGDEAKEIALKLMEIWNNNPYFKECDWREI